MTAEREVHHRKLAGSVLAGEVELPGHITFVYVPAEFPDVGYRTSAKRREAKLSIIYESQGLVRKKATGFRIQEGELVVKGVHGQQTFATSEIEQLFTTQSSRSGRHALLLRAGGKDHVLLDELKSEEEAWPIEQLIEEFLKVDDDTSFDLKTRETQKATKVLIDSKRIRAETLAPELASIDHEIAHTRIRVRGFSRLHWVAYAHLAILSLGLSAGFFGRVGVVAGLGAAVFWGFFGLRSFLDQTKLVADSHSLLIQRRPWSFERTHPILLDEIRRFRVEHIRDSVDGQDAYHVAADYGVVDERLFSDLDPVSAEAIVSVLNRHLKEAKKLRKYQKGGRKPKRLKTAM